MKVRVKFTLTRTNPVVSGYHPDWVGPDKPAYNGARVFLDAPATCGEEVDAVLAPLAPEQWGGIRPGSRLECREGRRVTGQAVVVAVEVG